MCLVTSMFAAADNVTSVAVLCLESPPPPLPPDCSCLVLFVSADCCFFIVLVCSPFAGSVAFLPQLLYVLIGTKHNTRVKLTGSEGWVGPHWETRDPIKCGALYSTPLALAHVHTVNSHHKHTASVSIVRVGNENRAKRHDK